MNNLSGNDIRSKDLKQSIDTRTLLRSLILGAIITSVLGTLAHFTYDWSGQNRLIGLVSATNESTWEHMKLLFFPMLLVSIFLTRYLEPNYPCILPSILAGNLMGTFLIPVLFYTYSGILGTTIDAVNIAIYYICVIIAFYCTYRLGQKKCAGFRSGALMLLTFILILLFFIFTYYPPNLGIFEDPTPP